MRRASVDAEAEGGLAGTLRASVRRASVGGADGGDISGIGGGEAKVSSVVLLEVDAFKSQQIIEKFEEIAIEGAPGIQSHFDEIDGAQEISSSLSGQTLIKAEKGMGWGKTSITVRASHEVVAASFIGSNYILRQAAEKYVFVTPMLGAVVKNKLCKLRKVEGKAVELGEKEGREIGESLARSLAINTQPVAAVDAFILNFSALQELDEEYEWFRPMLETISYRLLEEVPWGLKARVTVGALTSMADLLTDVYVTYMFWSDEKYEYFKASLASLVVSVGIQMFTVWLQNKKLGMKRVLREWFPILIGFKPAVDAYRVAKGEKQEAGQALDAMAELTVMKCIEMFAEAIPGVIIQLMAIATNQHRRLELQGHGFVLTFSFSN